MEMWSKHIFDLLLESDLSPIAYPCDTPEKPPRLFVPLVSGRRQYLLELREEDGQRSWRIFEPDELPFYVTSVSFQRESPSMR